MILGIFGGKTVKSFEAQRNRLAKARARVESMRLNISDGIDQAMADRSAAIYALSQELRELGDHKASL